MNENRRKIEFLKRAITIDTTEFESMHPEWVGSPEGINTDPEEYEQLLFDATLDGLMMSFDSLDDEDYFKYISEYGTTLYKVIAPGNEHATYYAIHKYI